MQSCRSLIGRWGMANTLLTTEALRKGIDKIFEEVYANHSKNVYLTERYILEQCGKLYRVKDTTACTNESRYKTDWLPLKQAQGFLKLLRGNEQDDL